MDIKILRDGKQTGPYTDEAVQEMLKQGRVLVNDLAWRPGLPAWIPLMNVLYPSATPPPAPPIPPPALAAATREPATARQKAFLTYAGITFTPEIRKDDASQLVNDAMENPKDPARLARWNEERLHLHPELFAAEIKARKENRPQRFLEICHGEGAAFFAKVTKAHCQVLVSHLDVHVPNWDTREHEAAAKHFFPALAGKFPQLLTEAGKAKFKSSEKSPAAAKPARSSPVAAKTRPSSGTKVGKVLSAMMRGVFLGLLILGLLWVARDLVVAKPPVKTKTVPAAATAAEEAPAPAAPSPAPAAPSPAPEPTIATTEPAGKPPELFATLPEPAPMKPEPDMAAAAVPAPAVTSPALPLFGETPAPAAAPALIPPSPARTSVILTRPVEITLPFGKVSVPPGTAVRIISQNGGALTVRYLEHQVTIPASSTDLGTDPAAAKPALPQ